MTFEQSLVRFLSSGDGFLVTTAVFAMLGLGASIPLFARLRAIERVDERKRAPRRYRGRRGQAPTPGSSGADLSRVIATVIAAGCLLLPLVFTIALEDVFAQPKTALLRGLAVALCGLLVVAVARGARPKHVGALEIALVVYVGLSILATVFSIDPGHSLSGERLQYQGLLSILSYVALFVAARFSIATVPRVQGLSMALLASATLVAAYAIAQGLGLDPIWNELFKDRVFSTVGQANALASVLGMAAVLALALVAEPRRGIQALVLIAVLVVAAALVLTFSRGGYLGLVLGAAVAGAVLLGGESLSGARVHLPKAALGVIGGLAVIGALAATWPPAGTFAGRVIDRMASIPEVSDTSNRSHLDLWEVGIRIAAEHPVLGTGPDTYVLVFPEYRDRVLTPERAVIMARFRPESAHNVYISTAAGAGVPALVAYLVIIGSIAARGLRVARQQLPRAARFALAGLMGGAAVHLVTDAFMTAEPSSSAIFWVLLGSTAGLAGTVSSPESAVTTAT